MKTSVIFLLGLLASSVFGTIYWNEEDMSNQNKYLDSEVSWINNTLKETPTPIEEIKKEIVKLNAKQGLLMNQILEVYSVTNAKSDLCRNHSRQFTMGLKRFETWALNMFDASSKIQSGLLYGNLYEFGNFKQCVSIYATDVYNSPIRGKHCTLKVFPNTKLLKKILSFRNISEKRWEKVKIFVDKTPLAWSICVPDSCDVDDVLAHFRKLIKSLTEGLNLTVGLREINCLVQLDDSGFNETELAIMYDFQI